jgi:hypothetical protein
MRGESCVIGDRTSVCVDRKSGGPKYGSERISDCFGRVAWLLICYRMDIMYRGYRC